MEEQLITVFQGQQSAVEYMLEFSTLAGGSRWNQPVFNPAFQQGLKPDVITELTCHDDKVSLDSLIDLTIHLDQLLLNQRGKGLTEVNIKSRAHLSPCS